MSDRIQECLTQLSASIREKIHLRRVFQLETSGRIFHYCHNAPPGEIPGLGKIASVVAVESAKREALSESTLQALLRARLGQSIAMHVAAMKPLYLSKESVDADHLSKEVELLKTQAAEAGKPSNIVDRIVEGRLKKFYEEFCLMQQPFVVEEGVSVEKALLNFGKEQGLLAPITIAKFVRIQCGEGCGPSSE